MTSMEKAFGIICVVLLATLVGVLSYCIPTIVTRNNTVTSLNAQLSSLNIQLSTKNYQVIQLNQTVADLQNVTGSLNDTLNLKKYQILCHRLGYRDAVNLWDRSPQYEGNISYAGCIVVQISSNGWPNDTIEVKYSFQSLNYDEKTPFDFGITAIFPVLPSSDLKVFAFTQANVLTGPAEADITITYYY
jgi:hypothetical protein